MVIDDVVQDELEYFEEVTSPDVVVLDVIDEVKTDLFIDDKGELEINPDFEKLDTKVVAGNVVVKDIVVEDLVIPVDTPEVKEIVKTMSVDTKNNNWFRENKGWVLQVLGSHNEKNIDDFIARFPSYEWHKYQRILNEKNYYVVVLGAYNSKDKVVQMLLTAPAEIKALDTWNRSIESIRPLLDQ